MKVSNNSGGWTPYVLDFANSKSFTHSKAEFCKRHVIILESFLKSKQSIIVFFSNISLMSSRHNTSQGNKNLSR